MSKSHAYKLARGVKWKRKNFTRSTNLYLDSIGNPAARGQVARAMVQMVTMIGRELGAEEAGCGDHDAAVDRAIVDRALRSVMTSLLLKPA